MFREEVIVLRHRRRARKLAVVEPCTEEWDAMVSEGGARFCAACQTSVTDLASMTEAEVDAWLVTAGDRVCIRMRVDESGRPLFSKKRSGARAHPMAGIVTAATLSACSVPPVSDTLSSLPAGAPKSASAADGLAARAKGAATPSVLQSRDLPRDDSATCEPAVQAPPACENWHYVAGNMALPTPPRSTRPR
jgi:hypothetical protein